MEVSLTAKLPRRKLAWNEPWERGPLARTPGSRARTLLYNHFALAERLLRTGAAFDFDLAGNAEFHAAAGYDQAGLGGQTPIYHAIGGNLRPDLNAVARVQDAPLYEPPTGIETLTPLDYALRYAQEPRWRQSEREAAMIRSATNG